jgi:hypothetical protein
MPTKPQSTYRSAFTLAVCVTILCVAAAVIAGVGMVATASRIELLDSAKYGAKVQLAQAEASDLRQRFLAVIGFGVGVPAIILSMMWVYRANRNARALGAEGMKYSPAWSVGWFFVPLASLVMPYFVIKEIWQASRPVSSGQWRKAFVSPILPVWWVIGLIAGMIRYSRWHMLTRSPAAEAVRFLDLGSLLALDSEIKCSWGLLIGDAVSIAATVLTIVVVLCITDLQEQKHEMKAEMAGRQSTRAASEPTPLADLPSVDAGIAGALGRGDFYE